MDVEQQRAAGVRDVGDMEPSGGEPPDEEGVDRSERQVAALGPLAEAGRGIEDVADLRSREVGIDRQPGLLADGRFVAGRPKLVAERGGDTALPDDGRRDGPTGRAIPHDRRLALVRDPDGGDLAPGSTRATTSRATASCESQMSSGSCVT